MLVAVMPLPVSTRPTMRCPGFAGPSPALGRGWLLPGKSVAQQFDQHQRLVDGAHAHALGDGVPEALVGGGGVRGHGRPHQGSLSEPGRISAFTRASSAFT